MRAVMVARWRRVRPGKGCAAAQYVSEVNRYWAEPADHGLCSRPKWRWDADGAGHWFVEGAAEDLLALSATTRARWQTLKGPFVLDDFAENIYFTGSRKRHRSMEALLREGNLV